MRHGFVLTSGDPRTPAEHAAAAEATGWDGVFYGDAIAVPGLVCWDPWVVMTAIAKRTERVTGARTSHPRPSYAGSRPGRLAADAARPDPGSTERSPGQPAMGSSVQDQR